MLIKISLLFSNVLVAVVVALLCFFVCRGWGGGEKGINTFPHSPIVHSSLVLANPPTFHRNIPHNFLPKISGVLRFVFVGEVQHNGCTASVANQLQGTLVWRKAASVSVKALLCPAKMEWPTISTHFEGALPRYLSTQYPQQFTTFKGNGGLGRLYPKGSTFFRQ